MIRKLSETSELPFWIDVVNPNKKELSALAENHKLHPVLVRDSLDPNHLPKFERTPQGRFFILRHADLSVIRKFEADTVRELTRKLAVFVLDDGIITIHRSEQQWLDSLMTEWRNKGISKREELPHLFNEIAMAALLSFTEPLNIAEDLFESYESQLLARGKEAQLIENLYFLKRKVTVYRKMLQASVDALTRMDDPNYKSTPYYEDLLQEGKRQHFHADELTDDVNLLLQTQLSLASHRTNEVMRVLTVFSAFFLPLTFIVGIYGMNFHHMPELSSPYGYSGVWVLMITTSISITFWFRKKHWF